MKLHFRLYQTRVGLELDLSRGLGSPNAAHDNSGAEELKIGLRVNS